MIFALLFILIFAGLVTFNLFGSQPNVATQKAQVYAQNMSVFHQAAMLQVNADMNPGPKPWPNCPGTLCAAVALNNELLTTTSPPYSPNTSSQLYQNWKEYTPMVTETLTSGWQSFLLRYVNGTNGDVAPTSDATESYVLTIFRGFAPGGSCRGSGGPAKSFGGNGADNLSLGLAKTVTERAGLGFLNCSGTTCQFNRYATDTGGTDTALQFNTTLFNTTKNVNGNLYFNGNGNTTANLMNGCAAMMTRVNAN